MLAAARAGDTGAQVNVGYSYDVGQGAPRSRTKALYWYRRALRNGVAYAATNIGTVYRDEGRPKLAERWFQKAASLGDDDAWLDLAKLYLGPLQNAAHASTALTRLLVSTCITMASREEGARLKADVTALTLRRQRGRDTRRSAAAQRRRK